jgi:hypothetical protein
MTFSSTGTRSSRRPTLAVEEDERVLEDDLLALRRR